MQAPPVEPQPTPSPAPTPTPYEEPRPFTLGYASGSPLHPLQAGDQSNLDVDSLVYEGLFRLDERFEPQGVLAESAEPGPDGLTWTVRLRADAVFSDGSAVTARQACACLLAAKQSALYAQRLAHVTAVTAGEGVLTVTLDRPNGALAALLDAPIFLEREEGLPLGTGPYAFSQDGESLSLRFNPAWWQGAEPPFESIPLRAYVSPEERAAAFGIGEISAVTCDFNAAQALGYSGTYETHDYATVSMLYLGFNADRDRPCADALVRRAVSRALDRSYAVTTLLAGHAVPAALPVHPDSPLYHAQSAGQLGYDLDAASALLEQAGWTRNDEGRLVQGRRSLSLTLCVNRDNTVRRSVAAAVAKSLEGLGVEVTVQALDWEKYTAALVNGDFDLYLGEVKLTADFDFSELTAGALNFGAFRDEALKLAQDAFRASRGAARGTSGAALYTAFAGAAPFAPICFKNNSLLARWGMVRNLAPLQGAPFAGIGDWVFLEPA